MTTSGAITMTMREVDRLRTIQSVVDGVLMPWQAAERLHLSRRQVERRMVRYRSQGASGLLSRHRGHPSNYQLADGVAERALNLIRERYPDFGPTLACEKLRECHGIRLAKETVRRLMTDAGLWIPPSAASRTASSLNSRPYRLYSLRSMRHLAELVRPSFHVSTERG